MSEFNKFTLLQVWIFPFFWFKHKTNNVDKPIYTKKILGGYIIFNTIQGYFFWSALLQHKNVDRGLNSLNGSSTYRLTTRVLSASPSMSSATMTKGLRWAFASSKAGMIVCTLEIFFSLNSNKQSLNSTLAPEIVLRYV